MERIMTKTDVLILGAGISGLSCASKLEDQDYLIVEKEDCIGGYCRTFRCGEYVWDFAGHFFHFHNPEIQNEFHDLISGSDIVQNQKNTKIYFKGNYIDYPFQFNIHQLCKEDFIDCLVGLFSRENQEYSTFKQMLLAKYGKGISEKFLIPYNSKLYACDLDKLDKDAMGRFFPNAEPVEIVCGFKKEQKHTYNETFSYSKRGAVAFVSKVAEKVDRNRILCGIAALAINLNEKYVQTDKGKIYYNRLVNTIPFDSFLSLCKIKSAVDYSSNQVIVFNFGFDKGSNRNDLHWVYYPERDICFYRVGFYNNILHEEKMSIYVEVGLDNKKQVDIDKLRDEVISDLQSVGVIADQKIVASMSLVMNPAYVHISKEASEEKDRIKCFLQYNDVYTIGRYGDWTYCSIEDCVIMAYEVAEKLRKRCLKGKQN